ncbi:hypothetical protein T05_15014 [Trichinella murrelli]|uniref:Uncharacterized protein n=1 Tax=Trichinella murrelli TaxID=144512 RepID=A0A0V0U952_9BILA|nr:hypothetical protein T05_15014 [Trichinella murrelli]
MIHTEIAKQSQINVTKIRFLEKSTTFVCLDSQLGSASDNDKKKTNKQTNKQITTRSTTTPPFVAGKGVEVEATVGLANGQLTERRRYGRSRHSKAGLPAGAPGDHVT